MQSKKVLTVKSPYAKQKNLALPDNLYRWNANSVVGILGRIEYCGHTVAFKTYSKFNKLKKRIETPNEQQLIFCDTHEAIVDEAVWERPQKLRENRRRPTKAERQGFFSGLVFCSDCGSKLHFATCKRFDQTQDLYRCSDYKSNTGSYTAHFIREETLKQLVLSRIFGCNCLVLL